MFADILSPASYIMISREAVHRLGLTPAVYCAELLIIYKKVVKKETFVNDDFYFKVDRKYIEEETALTVEEQLTCDKNLEKAGIIKILSNDPDCIFFDLEMYGSIIASEDIKLLDSVTAKMKVKQPKGVKQAAKDRAIARLKDSVECTDPDIKFAFNDWIEAVANNGKCYLTEPQVRIFKEDLTKYCNEHVTDNTTDQDFKDMVLHLLKLATVQAYSNFEWVANMFENKRRPAVNTPKVRVTEQKICTELGTEGF